MNSIYYGLSLAASLQGNSCLISRLLPPQDTERPANYFTLHQVAYKIFRMHSNQKTLIENLSGPKMLTHTRNALIETFNRKPSTEEVEYYCNLIRKHKNNSSLLRLDPHGVRVLSCYQKSLASGTDWEDSLQTARWFLANEQVTSLYRFPYQNIILVHPEILLRPKHKNALDFFISLNTWIENYTNWNVYIVTDQGHVTDFEGSFLANRRHLSNRFV